MSDTPQGPGWWQASDGKWYPPQATQPPPGASPKKKGGCLKWVAIAGGLFVLLIVVIAVAGGGSGTKTSTPGASDNGTKTTTSGDGGRLFPGRVDAQDEDQERNIGESAKLSGYTATVTAAAFRQELSSFEQDGYLVIEVTIENRDSKAQPYNTFDWKLQTPNGQVIDPGFSSNESLGSGDLVSGGKVSGKVTFEVGSTKGDFYIIYKPDPFDAARGVWKATV